MEQLTPYELKSWMKQGRAFFLADVREEWEHAEYNIGGTSIPLGTIMSRKLEFPHDQDIVLYCEKGIRSVIAIQRLEENGFTRLFNLSGGIKAWKEMR